MSKTLPADAVKTNCDASTDDPKQALLTDLAGAVDMVNALKAALGTAALLNMGNGVEIETSGVGVSDLLRLKFSALAKSAAYTVTAADRAKMINCTGTWSLAFEPCATLGDGWFALVRNVSTGTITLDPDLTETIDGATTLALAAGESALVVCNGSVLVTVGKQPSRLLSKVVTTTFNLASAHGTIQDITGFGFNPTCCTINANKNSTPNASWGMVDSAAGQNTLRQESADTTFLISGNAIYYSDGAGNTQIGTASYITDGVRITWAKNLAPTGTLNISVLGMR